MPKAAGDYTVMFSSEMLDEEYLPLEGKVAAVRDERLTDEVSIQNREAHNTKVKRIRRTAHLLSLAEYYISVLVLTIDTTPSKYGEPAPPQGEATPRNHIA